MDIDVLTIWNAGGRVGNMVDLNYVYAVEESDNGVLKILCSVSIYGIKSNIHNISASLDHFWMMSSVIFR
jgi:hypothetical protein